MGLLGAPRNYWREMLQKLFWWNFGCSFAQVVLVVAAARPVHDFLKDQGWLTPVHLSVSVFGFAAGLAYVVAALAIASFLRWSRLHDTVSNWFHLREGFDIRHIITPLAGGVGFALRLDDLEGLRKNKDFRDKVLGHIFYAYVSGSAPRIDLTRLEKVFDRWLWFWLLIEQTVVGVVAWAVLIVCWSPWAGVYGIALFLAVLLALGVLYGMPQNTYAEVREILEKPEWRDEVLGNLNGDFGRSAVH